LHRPRRARLGIRVNNQLLSAVMAGFIPALHAGKSQKAWPDLATRAFFRSNWIGKML
jgi:hypothetical protein